MCSVTWAYYKNSVGIHADKNENEIYFSAFWCSRRNSNGCLFVTRLLFWFDYFQYSFQYLYLLLRIYLCLEEQQWEKIWIYLFSTFACHCWNYFTSLNLHIFRLLFYIFHSHIYNFRGHLWQLFFWAVQSFIILFVCRAFYSNWYPTYGQKKIYFFLTENFYGEKNFFLCNKKIRREKFCIFCFQKKERKRGKNFKLHLLFW